MSATCPKCAGTKRVPITEKDRKYIHVMAGYEKATHTLPCDNCGGQTMSLTATGVVTVDPSTGLGCMHAFEGRTAGRCYTLYSCIKCGFAYSIDSGD